MRFSKLIEPTVWAMWAVVVGGACLWVIVGSIGYFVKENWLPTDTSGWVQAIGAIVAIGIAIWVPYRQRRQEANERASAKAELEVSRTEQLNSLNKELEMLVSDLPYEWAGADYNLTNEMSRKLFEDLIDRLNYWQREELCSERLGICLSLRIELYGWLKFFSEKENHDGGALYRKTERGLPRIDLIDQRIHNVKRRLEGLEPIPVVKKTEQPEESELPF
ncbi:hypothetical protein [Pseudomonas sp. NBRC 111133]|uniref:hypothetical protein n=1 Tax=Pseudomonas sp. NBRC 111133 TaxID=1661048 RepID=UPI0012E2F2EF|nr:hypothetical protein [Pseudomonas sp. NBRC 111133]